MFYQQHDLKKTLSAEWERLILLPAKFHKEKYEFRACQKEGFTAPINT